MNCVSLFSGIGGFDLAFQRAGIEVVEQVEIDKNRRQILSARFPEAHLHEDVTKYEPTTKPDIVCGGFPCQDLSVAGRRAGLAGKRSGLFFEFVRIVGAAHPKYVVIENVPGLLSSNGGRDMGTVIGELAKLGFSVAWRVLDAQYFGLAQRRKRVFIVGCSSARRAAEILLEPEGLPGNTPPSREKRQEVTECVGTVSANGGGTNRPAGNANELDFCVAAPLTSGSHPNSNAPGRHREDNENLVAHQVTRSSGIKGADHETYVAWHENKEGNLSEGVTAKALRAGASHSYQGVGVRRLTPLECERLQGFPDGWTDGFADSVRYRMLGNAVAVPVAEWIGQKILEQDANSS